MDILLPVIITLYSVCAVLWAIFVVKSLYIDCKQNVSHVTKIVWLFLLFVFVVNVILFPLALMFAIKSFKMLPTKEDY